MYQPLSKYSFASFASSNSNTSFDYTIISKLFPENPNISKSSQSNAMILSQSFFNREDSFNLKAVWMFL